MQFEPPPISRKSHSGRALKPYPYIMSIPTNYLTASECIDLVSKGQLTIEQIALDHLARYDERDPVIHAWAYVDRELVMNEARRLDALPKEERGPLHGAVLGVKDMISEWNDGNPSNGKDTDDEVIDTKDLPTQHNSPIYKDHRPNIDAGPVAICRAAGALIFGKTHTTEFASTSVGPPACNPYDRRRTPGGSSSGSGAAVSDYQCSFAFGTQTGGSTIRPGSYNGIFALKPTWGAITREGLKICSITLDTLGLYARSIEDLKLLAQVFRIQDDVPPPVRPKPLSSCKFAYIKTDQWDASSGPSPELISAWEKSATLLREAGAEVVDVDLPSSFDKVSGGKHQWIMDGEARASFLPEYMVAKDQLADFLQSHVENRTHITRKMQLQAYDEIAALRPVIDKLASEYDAIVTPAVPGEAPMGLGHTGDMRFCSMWTALHVPCVNIPGFASVSGMPIGLTLVAPRYEDERLLSIAGEVAKVWVGADADKLNEIPAPKGSVHLKV
ncbi:hypothetical protein IAR55_005432 [Kwoniella newhampshirensis]|uniref:Amidase domain-containing protein n=1 Tax=Kwoniella newhampshirensis TaxID=1651941 RepID=A0AAW0YTR9_9TREE